MKRYILRRLLYMIPTFVGILLITFILFNVVGGSPAAMSLGKNASPQSLEEFDEQRGFNKPLIAGLWTKTRALSDVEFTRSAVGFDQTEGVAFVAESPDRGFVRFAVGRHVLPFSFPPARDTVFSLRYTARYGAGARIAWSVEGAQILSATDPAKSGPWQEGTVVFRTAAGKSPFAVTAVVEGGGVDVRSFRLRRRTTHWWDSQLLHYLGRLARLDLGSSTLTNQKVTELLKEGVAPSLSLTVPIFFGELLLALALALVCAYMRNRLPDRILVVGAVVLMSVNYLVWIIVGQYVMAYRWNWFPIWGYESWHYLALPVTIGILSGLGGNLRFYRTIMLDEMYKEYVRTAFAKGVAPAGVLFKHVLPNAMIPIITNTVIALPFLYTGSLLLESFFGIPGLGGISVNAINSSDVDVVRGVVIIGAILYMFASLMTDICYALVDPRVKLK